MYSRFGRWAVALTAGAVLGACQESSAPRAESSGPRFSTASDTGGGGGGGGTQVFHFVANGDAGSVNWFNFAGDSLGGFTYTIGYLNVARGGSTKSPLTFLDYSIYQFGCDPYWNCFYNLIGAGYGIIPNRDLSGGGKQLQLSTNTANDPSFFVYWGGGGQISVKWNSNGFGQISSSGTTSYRFGNFTYFSQGSSSYASANASGSVVGIPIAPNPYAQTGSNHNVTLAIYR
jgi:hypothetical protein